MAKYDPLSDWLRAHAHRSEATLSFADIEQLIGDGLPASAHRHRAWWANHAGTHVHAEAWLSTGWLVDGVDQRLGRVRFRRTTPPVGD